MKKLLIGLGVFVLSTSLFASTIKLNESQQSLGQLEGRYALDCSKNKAHDLSYVISNTQITRLISAKKKNAAIKSIQADPVTEASYGYITTAKYQGFRVDFYQKDGKHFAKVKSRSISNFYGPKTKKLLQQCSTTKS